MARRRLKTKKPVKLGWMQIRQAIVCCLTWVAVFLVNILNILNPFRYLILIVRRSLFTLDDDGRVIHRLSVFERIKDFFKTDGTSRRHLLHWAQSKLPHVRINNIGSCWSDGINLCSLIDAVCPGACPRPDLLKPQHKVNNCRLGLRLANKHLAIPMTIITPEEMALPSGRSEEKMRQLLVVIKRSGEDKRKDATQETRISTVISKPQRACNAKGSGLVVGLVSKRCKFIVNVPAKEQLDLYIDIRGPDETYCYERITSLVQHRTSISQVEETILVGSLETAALSSSRRNSELTRSESTNSDKSGTGLRIPFDYQYMEEDNFLISYIPRCSGVHVILVKWHKKNVKGSPFRANIAETVEKLNQGSKGRMTQQNIMPDVQDESPPEEISEELNAINQNVLSTKGLFPTISNVARLTKQATITRRRVLRRVFTKGGQEVVIHEASDSSRQNSSEGLSRQNSRDNTPSRPGSPNPNHRHNRSFDFEIGYESDTSSKSRGPRRQISLVALAQMQKSKVVKENRDGEKQTVPELHSVGKLASEMANNIVKDAIDSSNAAKSSENENLVDLYNEQKISKHEQIAQPVKWKFHSDLERRTSSPLEGRPTGKHDRVKVTKSVPRKSEVSKTGTTVLTVPLMPECQQASPKKVVGKTLSHHYEKKAIDILKCDASINNSNKGNTNKLTCHRKICGTLSEPLGSKDKVRNWLEKSSSKIKEDYSDICSEYVQSSCISEHSKQDDDPKKVTTTEQSQSFRHNSNNMSDCQEPHTGQHDSVKQTHSVPSCKSVGNFINRSGKTLDDCESPADTTNSSRNTVSKLIQSDSLRKSCFYISQGALIESSFQSDDKVSSREIVDHSHSNKEHCEEIKSSEQSSTTHHPCLGNIKHSLLRLSRSLPTLSKSWNTFELDSDDEDMKIEKPEICSKQYIKRKRATLGSGELLESVHELQRLRNQSNSQSEGALGSTSSIYANPGSISQSVINSEPERVSPTTSEGKSVGSSRRSSLLRHDVVTLHRVSEENSLDIENLESGKRYVDSVSHSYNPNNGFVYKHEDSGQHNSTMIDICTQVHSHEIKRETAWETPSSYLKRKKNSIKIGESRNPLKSLNVSIIQPNAQTQHTNNAQGNNNNSQNGDGHGNLQPVRQSTIETVDSGIADDHHIISLRELIASRLHPRMLNGHRIVTRRTYRGKISLDPKLVQNNLTSGDDEKENYLSRRGIRRWTKAASDIRKQRRKVSLNNKSISVSDDARANKTLKSKKGRNRRVMFSRRIMIYRRSSSRSSRSSKHSRESKSPMHSLSLQDDSIAETPEPIQTNPMEKIGPARVNRLFYNLPKKNIKDPQYMPQTSRDNHSQVDNDNECVTQQWDSDTSVKPTQCTCVTVDKNINECNNCYKETRGISDTGGEDSGINLHEPKDEITKSDKYQLQDDEHEKNGKNGDKLWIPDPFSNLPVDNLHDIVERLDVFCELTANCGMSQRGIEDSNKIHHVSAGDENNVNNYERQNGFPDFLYKQLSGEYISFTGIGVNSPQSNDSEINWTNNGSTSEVPDPSEVKVFGQNIQVGSVGVPNSFQVLTPSSAGHGSLSVGVRGPRPFTVKETSTTFTGDDLYEVSYEVTQPGYYFISVRWADLPAPGSPFVCKVTY